MSVWDAVRYGFSPIYWVQISGIPVVFCERATGLTLPAGWTAEDGSLVIDDSAEVGIEQVDRDTGTAVSLSFGFKLLDTSTVRQWLRAPSKSMNLTSNLTATATTMNVDSSTGWSNGDAAYLGMERITIGTVASSTYCTGLTRATVGTLAFEHKTGTTAQIVTDRPRFWRGREVTLWASPADPNGYATGTALLNDAVQVWRGRIDQGPSRDVDGFKFEASSIDRITDRKLAASVTGQVVSTSAKIAVSKGYTIQIVLKASNSSSGQVFGYVFNLLPFKNDSDGDLLTNAEIRDRIQSAWDDAVSAEGATSDLGGFLWANYSGEYNAKVLVKADATIVYFAIFAYLDGKSITATWLDKANGWSTDGYVALDWKSKGNPLVPGDYFEPVIPWLITVRVDDGNPGDIPQKGRLRVNVGGKHRLFRYHGVTANNAEAYIKGITPIDGTNAYPTKTEMLGADAEVLFGDEGTFPTMMLRCLMSSGNGERSATYDTLSRGQGYGLDEGVIDEGSFTAASAPIGSLKGEVASGGESFSGLFGGALGLFRKAVVSRPDTSDANGALKLTLVDTAPYGSGWSTTLTDTDLLSHDGDPVVSVKKAESPNVLVILRPFGGTDDGEDRFVFVDAPTVDANGRDEVEYRVPASDRVTLYQAAGPAAVERGLRIPHPCRPRWATTGCQIAAKIAV